MEREFSFKKNLELLYSLNKESAISFCIDFLRDRNIDVSGMTDNMLLTRTISEHEFVSEESGRCRKLNPSAPYKESSISYFVFQCLKIFKTGDNILYSDLDSGIIKRGADSGLKIASINIRTVLFELKVNNIILWHREGSAFIVDKGYE